MILIEIQVAPASFILAGCFRDWGQSGDSLGTVLGESWENLGTVWGESGDSLGRVWGQSGESLGTIWGQSGDRLAGIYVPTWNVTSGLASRIIPVGLTGL